jgi:hypothetical protein
VLVLRRDARQDAERLLGHGSSRSR